MDPIDAQLAAARVKAAMVLGRTPLIEACAKLDEATALDLIAKGEDLALADRNGRTPLHEAVRHAYKDEAAALRIVTALLDAGAPVDPVEKENRQTPLVEAAIYGAPEILKLLIARGANVNHKMKDKTTPLGTLTATAAMMKGRAEAIKILEAAGGTGRKR